MKSFGLTLCSVLSLLWILNSTLVSVSGAQSFGKKGDQYSAHDSSPGSSLQAPSSLGQSLPVYVISLAHPPEKGIQVGDLLEFRLDSPPSEKVLVQEPTDLLDQGWELDSSRPSGYTFFVLPIRSGKVHLPSFTLVNEKGKPIGQTQALSLDVQSALSQEEKQAVGDSVGPIPPLGVQFPVWVIVLLGVVAFALCGVAIYFWRKRRSQRSFSPAPVDLRTDDEIALDELKELEQRQLLEKARYKEFYFSLSEILKKYISCRYQFHAREATTHEILLTLKTEQYLDHSLLSDLEQIFHCLDQVKFTDYMPQLEEGHQVLERVRGWILRTKKLIQVIQHHQSGLETSKNASA